MRPGLIPLVLCVLLGFVGRAESRGSIVLYDASTGDRPGDQPWLLYADNSFLPGTSISQEAVPGEGTRLVSNMAAAGGYSNVNPITSAPRNPDFPALDRSTGFEVGFDLLVTSESHTRSDRAGFSLIALAGDGLGIELGFWEGEIWAQETGFTRGEGVAFDATAGMASYALRVFGDSYALSASGTEILSGSLRDYSGAGFPPYTLGSFLFFGDNTTSAAADVTLGTIRLAVVPEPGSLALCSMAISAGLLIARSASRRGARRASP
ncbi:choice-of-anchor Y domain-containing protein [Tautonia plasticadhaerens]|uniref:PEP-CTERM protein-sorting domain-containing protein n=1 Tax=Tautonia plasticadhaerens TaxID=2527974 RepID=A0A518H8T3_9BACT|nr:hypothetical protein [Tautonia plasticadhaerens]QDV37262.1 hypothetical protein ElP_51970 [Tautonia plasticadhaerens]